MLHGITEDKVNKEKILITGASGFIGGNLLSGLKKLNIETVGTFKTKKSKTTLEYLDLNNYESVVECIKKTKPSIVIHSAAIADASKCEADKKAAFDSNVEGTKRLIEGLKHLEPKAKLILISTDLVFDGEGAGENGYTENCIPNPISTYGETKTQSEKIFLSSGIEGFIARISLAYGPSVGEASGFLGWMTKTLQSHNSLTLFEDEWRTPVFTEDLVKFFADWITGEIDLTSSYKSIIHLGGKDRLSRFEMGQIVADILDAPTSLLIKKLRSDLSLDSKRPKDVSLSSKLVAKLAGYNPQSFYTSVKGLLKNRPSREFTDFTHPKMLP